jgi:protein-tyrosine phosphatase
VLVLLPYLQLTWLVWHVQRLLNREPCCNEISPGVWLGRRPLAADLPPGVDFIVDVTAEFRVRGIARDRSYLCLPTLDTYAPGETMLCEAVSRIVGWPGQVYIHCALGHGRSAAVAAAVLLARGLAQDVADAEHMLRQIRPAVRLKPVQRSLLQSVLLPV